MNDVPLDLDLDKFATDHHGLVYKFLNMYDLPEDEYYDVIIFGYLKGVHDYSTKEHLQKYSFSTIAWKTMLNSLSNYYKSQSRQKRKAELLSIHESLYPDGLPLEQTLPAQDDLMQQLEVKLLLHDLAGRVSKQQMDMVGMKSSGYGIREIARHQKIPMKRVQELLEEVRSILLELCYE